MHLILLSLSNTGADSKKKLVRNYLKSCGFYSYDAAAAEEENPVMRWIGREVKRFLAEAHIHVPFLLRVVAAPPDMDDDMASMMNEAGVLRGEEEDELNLAQCEPSPEDLRGEGVDEPTMMQHAGIWDSFLAMEAEAQREWADPDGNTDE